MYVLTERSRDYLVFMRVFTEKMKIKIKIYETLITL